MIKPIIARAFAKIIISGEHAVVYGQPALAMSVDRYVKTSIVSLPNTDQYTLILENFDIAATITQKQLQAIGQLQTLQQPLQLLQYALAKLIEKFNLKTDSGLEIRTISTIPISCGLGSSAALIVSLLHAVNHFFALNIKIEDYLVISTNIEHIQHGKSSGLDIYLATYGGSVRFENGNITPRIFADTPLRFINSGTSVSSTAECVNTVAKYFCHSTLANDFGAITNKLDEALQSQKLVAIKECICANNRLLNYIGIVPEKVQQFISDIEDRNGVAKICGAGAIEDDAAGIIMVMVDDDINDLLVKYGYEQLILKSNNHGVQIV
jgi:mevalonate kinase